MKFFRNLSLFVLLIQHIYSQINVVRGPYLQLATQNSITIKWRTDNATDSRVIYGLSPASLIFTSTLPASTTEHEIVLSGLLPDTKYYYSIGDGVNLLSSGPDQFFFTLPPSNTIRPYQFWVIGDCGSGDDNQRAVRNAYQNHVGNNRIDGIIMLGDNAYTFGTDGEYQGAVFANMYEDIISNTVMWPTPGNHDYYSGADATTQTGPYYDIFTLPKSGELGGVPSNTEAYYSYDIGNIHFISIDSYDSGRDSTNAMGNWIKQDLLNNTKDWTIAYWHHAPYTKGNHDSDNPFPWLDGELPEMREQIVPLMENGGVDLILCGHSHSYERSFLLDGHYGESTTLNASHIKNNGSGNFITDCPYLKFTQNGKAHKGTVFTVLGVSGKTDGPGSGWPHPAMHTATTDHLGSMLLTINGNRLDAKFLTSTHTIYDQFTIVKNAGGRHVIPVCQGLTEVLEPSFPTSQYTWMPGGTSSPNLTINPFFNSFYYGSDPMGCIRDTFQIVIIPPGSPADTCDWAFDVNSQTDHQFKMYPNPSTTDVGVIVDIYQPNALASFEWFDVTGRKLTEGKLNNGINLVPAPIMNCTGSYFINIHINQTTYRKKVIFTN